MLFILTDNGTQDIFIVYDNQHLDSLIFDTFLDHTICQE